MRLHLCSEALPVTASSLPIIFIQLLMYKESFPRGFHIVSECVSPSPTDPKIIPAVLYHHNERELRLSPRS